MQIKTELLFLLSSGRLLVLTTATWVAELDLVHRTSSGLCLNIGEKLHVNGDSDRTGLLFGD
jgi:hypothetical protein